MNYKEHYNELTNEAEVPFAAADIKIAKPINTGKYIPKI